MGFVRKTLKRFLLLILVLGGIFCYGVYIEPFLLTTEEITISHQSTGSNTGTVLTVALFSDTHLGYHYDLEQLEKVVAAINGYQPDLVLFAGDLIDQAHSYERIDSISPILANLQSTLGKYAVYGNHDYGGGAKRHYREIMEKSGFALLVNDGVKLTLPKGPLICIAGLDEIMLGQPDLKAVSAAASPVAFNLLLTHEPDVMDHYTENPFQLTVSGHSHGGQVQLPFIGPIITTAYAERYVEGLYTLDSTSRLLYVTTGLGTTKLPLRIGVPPQITILTIEL